MTEYIVKIARYPLKIVLDGSEFDKLNTHLSTNYRLSAWCQVLLDEFDNNGEIIINSRKEEAAYRKLVGVEP